MARVRAGPDPASQAQRAQLAAGAGALPDGLEGLGELARATGVGRIPFTVEAVAQPTKVVAARIVGQERRRVGVVDRVVDGPELESAGKALGQAEQGGVGALG